MADRRKKNGQWSVADENGVVPSWECAQIAVLMDLRDELQVMNAELRRLNQVMQCPNTIAIPRILRTIATNTKKKPRVRKAAAK